MKIGINGFGRIGRLALRAGYSWPDYEVVHINDPAGDAKTFAHLLEFDSVHGHWSNNVGHSDDAIRIDNKDIKFTSNRQINETDWSDCEIVIEASGKMKTQYLLNQYLEQGVSRVVVTAPVKEEGILNIVMGVNDHLYDAELHRIVTAASCTTNCLAPVVKVIHENLGIRHGSMTTIHDITNTQTILDAPHKDLRRARACGMSLIPTTTGSATAITHIFPELKGKLNGHAVRVPLANASLTDCVFEVRTPTTADAVNTLIENAANSSLQGILGYEERPLVSIDYRTDPRSGIVDALSTMVVNETQVKLYVWYDNEWGYANRTVEIVRMLANSAQEFVIAVFRNLSFEVRQYLMVTANYWAFTLTDGALRMLVVLYFNQLGYSPIQIAMLFLFYELFGVITNLVGGWLGAVLGLNRIMNIGLAIQILALTMLLVPSSMLSVLWVMLAQALSGIAKDLNKMSAKSAIKNLVPPTDSSQLFKWVAILTGSKNALKGAGFFLGGALLALLGFKYAVLVLATGLLVVWLLSMFVLKDLNKTASTKPKFREMFSNNRSINYLSAARLFLFAARDVWFVVALPVYMAISLGWDSASIGAFFAIWIMAYGATQAAAPALFARRSLDNHAPIAALHWVIALSALTAGIALAQYFELISTPILVVSLLAFGGVFAVNSALHSFLIVSIASHENTSMDVGFYYMANASGRLVGTVLSGFVFQLYGLAMCLMIATGFLIIAAFLSHRIDTASKATSF